MIRNRDTDAENRNVGSHQRRLGGLRIDSVRSKCYHLPFLISWTTTLKVGARFIARGAFSPKGTAWYALEPAIAT